MRYIYIYIDRKFLSTILQFCEALVNLICYLRSSNSLPDMTFLFGIHCTADRAIISLGEVVRIWNSSYHSQSSDAMYVTCFNFNSTHCRIFTPQLQTLSQFHTFKHMNVYFKIYYFYNLIITVLNLYICDTLLTLAKDKKKSWSLVRFSWPSNTVFGFPHSLSLLWYALNATSNPIVSAIFSPAVWLP